MKVSTLLGWSAFALFTGYLLAKKQEGEDPRIEGLDVVINPDRVLDGALGAARIDPQYHDRIKHVANRILDKAINR